MNKTYIIYKVTNKINNKIYIGKTYNLEKRKAQHLYDIDDGLPFHAALKKYGINNFEWEIIDYSEGDKKIREKEIYWIKKYNSCIFFENSQGYNLTLGGEGGASWNSKPVLQYGLDGKFLNEYISAAHASTSTGVQRRDIAKCANGVIKRAGKYIWRFKISNYPKQIAPYGGKTSARKHKVMQLDKDGFVLNIFDSLTQASKETSTPRTSISFCLNKTYGTANNFVWIYADEYNPCKDYKYKGIKEGKGIYQLDENKNIVNHFNNCTEAARFLNEPEKVHKQIFKAIKTGNKCRGFYWTKVESYANTEITQ